MLWHLSQQVPYTYMDTAESPTVVSLECDVPACPLMSRLDPLLDHCTPGAICTSCITLRLQGTQAKLNASTQCSMMPHACPRAASSCSGALGNEAESPDAPQHLTQSVCIASQKPCADYAAARSACPWADSVEHTFHCESHGHKCLCLMRPRRRGRRPICGAPPPRWRAARGAAAGSPPA